METGEAQRVLWCLNRKEVGRINKGLSDSQQLSLVFPDSDDNKRLLGQSGLFSKGPVMKHVDEWAVTKATSEKRPILLKIVFPGEFRFRRSALKSLQLMNITHSTLFPDIVGASLHCNIVAEDHKA